MHNVYTVSLLYTTVISGFTSFLNLPGWSNARSFMCPGNASLTTYTTHSRANRWTIQQIDDCNEKIKKLEERTDALVVAQKSLINTNKLLMEYVLGGIVTSY